MASRIDTGHPRRPDPRLYLISPEVEHPAAFADTLAAALAGAEVAAVLLRLALRDERSLINAVKAFAPIVQETGAALLVAGHADIVARAGADGAHLTGIDAFRAAQAALQPQRIAGCGGLASRHDAMLAGEAGADYVLFGEPDPAGRRPSFEAIADRVSWWAEIFEPPCSRNGSPDAEGSPPVMTPCWRAKPAPITSCSASPIRPDAVPRSRRLPIG